MTQSDLIKMLQKKMGEVSENITNKQVDSQVREFFSTIKAAISNGYTVELRGFGRFSTKERNARKITNPKTGALMNINHRKVPYFKAGKIRDELN